MAVIMPAAGLLYDRIGPRWPAVIGLALVALGTYMLTDVNLESSTSHVVWVLVLRAVGMGLAMMPIMTGGLSAVPPNQVDGASAFNNVVQRTSAALGLGRADLPRDLLPRAVRPGPRADGLAGHADARARAGADR